MRSLDDLERVSLMLVMGGLAALSAISVLYVPAHVSVSTVDESFLGDTVRVDANVSSMHSSSGVQFMTLTDQSRRLTAVYFGNKDLGVIPHHMYRIEGEVDMYHGELELVVHTIEPVQADM